VPSAPADASDGGGDPAYSLGPLVSQSDPMGRVFGVLGPTSRSQAPIHLVGESGTGKQPIGLAVHLVSGRPTFACIRCTGLSNAAELRHLLIGGGTPSRPEPGSALFQARKGTLLLLDIGGLGPESQAVLLGLLGSDIGLCSGGRLKPATGPRLVSTSAQDLEAFVRQGRFRADLYYRLAGAVVEVPPLRKRPEDIMALARLFLTRGNPSPMASPIDFTIDAGDLLLGYSWPGNVRQLRGVVEAAAAQASAGRITHATLGQFLVRSVPAPAVQIPVGTSLADAERMVIRATVAAHSGHRQDAADALGIARRTLYQKLCEHRAQTPEGEDFPRARRRKGSRGYVKKNGAMRRTTARRLAIPCSTNGPKPEE
jgi:DNA-binding NtrC family response regulator